MLQLTIGALLRDRARQHATCSAILSETEEMNWGEVDHAVDAWCAELWLQGVRPGMRTGIWSVNTPSFVLSCLALIRMGALPVPLNTSLTPHELLLSCRNVRMDYLLYGEGYKGCLFAQAIREITDQHSNQQYRSLRSLEVSVRKRLEQGCESSSFLCPELKRAIEEVKPEDTAILLFTSGTTGKYKGVQLSHLSLVNNAASIAEGMRWSAQDRLCVAVPFFHCFGVTASLLAAIYSGMSLAIVPRFRSIPCFEMIEKKGCTVLNGVPSMFLSMLNNPKFADYDLSSLRSGIVAGSRITPEDYLRICNAFGEQLHLQPSYGQTETSPACTLADWEASPEQKSCTVGRVLPGISLRIVDELDQPLPDGIVGAIQTRGYHVMQGYYRLPKESAEAFTADGWLRTGDLGFFTSAGELVITGRHKRILIRGGENLSPAEIESAIVSHPAVREALVIGIPDPILGEEVCAGVELIPGQSLSEESLRLFLSEQLAEHKIPRYLLFYQNLPRNELGKPLAALLYEDVCQHRAANASA